MSEFKEGDRVDFVVRGDRCGTPGTVVSEDSPGWYYVAWDDIPETGPYSVRYLVAYDG